MKSGEGGKGITSRWYPTTLAKRFENLDAVRDRIDFRCEDGLQVIDEYAVASDVVCFIDPPYTAGGKKAGKRLYRHYQLDPERLFAAVSYTHLDVYKRQIKINGLSVTELSSISMAQRA